MHIEAKQAAVYDAHIALATPSDSNTCLLQMDFAENFTCTWQDEIQPAHWRQGHVTLYTVMIFHRPKDKKSQLCHSQRYSGAQDISGCLYRPIRGNSDHSTSVHPNSNNCAPMDRWAIKPI